MRLANNPAFIVNDGRLMFGSVKASDVMAVTKPPFFVIVLDRARENCKVFAEVVQGSFLGARSFYSVKTSMQPALLRAIAGTGMGAQVVSSREFELALAAGFLAKDILVDGIFHDSSTYELLARHDGLLFVESWAKNIISLDRACKRYGKSTRLGLRFKFPKKGNRLGFSTSDSAMMAGLGEALLVCPDLTPCMLACHGGSQVQDPKAYAVACQALLDAQDALERTHRIAFQSPLMLDLGGGFPEPEMATPTFLGEVMAAIKDTITANHDLARYTIWFEPGRYIAGDAGALVASILHVFNDDAGSRWALLDIGMDVLTRFANSHYRFFSLEHPDAPHGTPISFQGRVPTEQDVFGKGVHFIKDAIAGEHVLLLNCGAYSTTFSMRFSFEHPDTAVVDDGKIGIEPTVLP
jgi:diaminopimelate decarboxylase